MLGFSQDFSTDFGFSGGYRSDVLLWGEKWTASAATFPLRSPGRVVKLPQKLAKNDGDPRIVILMDLSVSDSYMIVSYINITTMLYDI